MQLLHAFGWKPSYESRADVAQMSGERKSTFIVISSSELGIIFVYLKYKEDKHYASILEIEKLNLR